MDVALERLYPTPVQNSTLLPLLLLSLATQRHSPDPTSLFSDEYDYIVVGAGAGGSVVASRLSEMPCVSVLLLEAGHKPPLLTDVPVLAGYFHGSDVDWNYKSAPQADAGFGLVNNQFPWAAGKMLGGSTVLNSMIYVRGNRKDFDDWERMGAAGWNFNDVYKYFLKLEDNRDPEFLSDGYHSFDGPITAEQPRYEPEIKDVIREAVSSFGYQVLDSNAARQTGFYDHQAIIRNQQRCSTAKAYLVPAENRTNLNIVSNALVTKILTQGNEATGVQFDFEGLTYRASARKEVIVSGGSIQTPQLLKLSGIGPAEELRRLGIPVVADIPTGENFHNHVAVRYPFVLGPAEPDLDEKIANPSNIYRYIDDRTGVLCNNDGYLFTSFLKDLEIRPAVDFPDYELYFYETTIPALRKSGLKRQIFDAVYGPYQNDAIFTCTVQLTQPKSRGSVTLKSTDPYEYPNIDPRYLSDPRDVDVLVEGLKNCKRLVGTDAFRSFGATPLKTLIPGCEEYVGDDDAYFRCQVRTLLFTFHHPAGSSRMGDPLDPETVVDPELRVKNMRKLRVVDASVMPTVTSGNTNIPTVMIAEKASDLIKQTITCFNADGGLGDLLDVESDIQEEEPFDLLEEVPSDLIDEEYDDLLEEEPSDLIDKEYDDLLEEDPGDFVRKGSGDLLEESGTLKESGDFLLGKSLKSHLSSSLGPKLSLK